MELVTIFYTDENLNSDGRVDSISEGAAGAKGQRKSLPGDNNIWHLCTPGTIPMHYCVRGKRLVLHRLAPS